MTVTNGTNKLMVLLVALLLAAAPGATLVQATGEQPNLCDLDEGRWCFACSGSTCDPQDDEGWLCCSGATCVPVDSFDDCDLGVAGWCSDYYTETLRNGIEVATCEDEG